MIACPPGSAAAIVKPGVSLLCLALLTSIFYDRPAGADTVGILDAAVLDAPDGRQVYEKICQGCHMPDARGAAGAGRFPALALNLKLASRQYMALTVLKGQRNMPAFGAKYAIGFVGPPLVLNEVQIAAVVNYVRTHFGNHYKDPITAAEVIALDEPVR